MITRSEQDQKVVEALQAIYAELLLDPETEMLAINSDPASGGGRLVTALRQHPTFGEEQIDPSQPKHMAPNVFVTAMVIPRPLRRKGPDATLDWLYKLHHTTAYEVRLCGELIGIEAESKHVFSNGVVILPPDQMRYGNISKHVWAEKRGGLHEFRASSCGMMKIIDEQVGGRKPRDYQDFIDTALALSIATDGSPVVGACWDELEDEDLEETRISHGYAFDQFDGKPPQPMAKSIDPDAIGFSDRFLALSGVTRRATNIAAAKLNLAQRRKSAGDGIIEIATAFEALLATKGETGEITYRLKLRAALLLGASLEERIEIAEKVRRLYSLRSKLVHGEAEALSGDQAHELRQWGIKAVRALLRMVVNAGSLPNFEKLELTSDAEAAFGDL